MKNKIILVGEYCTTGKSTFSRKLSQFLDIPWFNKGIFEKLIK
jgi:shikimate kinase